MAGPYIHNSWLPPDIAKRLEEEEPRAFKAAVKRLQDAVAAASKADSPECGWPKVLPWLDEIKTLISTKTTFDHQDVLALVHTLWDVVLSTGNDVEVQVRMGELLSHVLRHHRQSKELREALTLPWRPLYDLLHELLSDPLPQLQGALLLQARHNMLFTLVARSRRFFAPTAAQEVWSTFRGPLLGDPNSSSAAIALGWLVLFFPTKALPHLEPEVIQGWVDEWMVLWGSLVHCHFWDSHWMYLIARSIKDDWKGVVRWGRHLPQLYNHMMWAFSVPVGTATASVPTSQSAPHHAAQLFGSKVDQVDDCSKSAAKIAIHLLKQPDASLSAAAPGTPTAAGTPSSKGTRGLMRMQSLGLGSAAEGSGVELGGILRARESKELVSEEPASSSVLAACDALDALVQLLEQYAHPSNTGQWSGDIAVFLSFGVHYFMKQLGRQCGLRGWKGEQRIVPEAARRCVRAAMKLAARGQFSKSGNLTSACCKAMCHLSYVWPQEVLPLVVFRFQAALETTTAMHQLPTAITTLAMCVRPMLLAGWHTREETTQQLIAEAMMAVLPGIDANDESKTAAVFQFYTAVLASLPRLHGADEDDDDDGGGDVSMAPGATVYRLPLYLEDWVEQVMERLVALLSNLDTGAGHKGTDTQARSDLLLRSSGIGKDTMYSNFFQHLLLRIPRRLALRVLQQLSHLASGSPLTSVAWEASSMFKTAAWVYPTETTELVLVPLIKKLMQELPEPGLTSVGRSLEDLLMWRLWLLGVGVGALPGDACLPLLPQLQVIMDACYQVPSRVALLWTSQLLSSALSSLTNWHWRASWAADAAAPRLPSGLQLWVDRKGTAWARPDWASPSPAHVAAAEQLVDKYLEQAGQQLVALTSAAGSTAASSSGSAGAAGAAGDTVMKYKLLALVNQMSSVVSGLMSRLKEFDGLPGADICQDGSNAPPGVQPLRVVGWMGPSVGKSGVRNRAATAFATAMAQLRHSDRDVLEVCVTSAMMLLANGTLEQMVAAQMRPPGQTREDMAVLEEPAAATSYLLESGYSLEQTLGFPSSTASEQQEAEREEVAGRWGEEWRWRKRTSTIAAMQRVSRMLVWRCGLSASRVQLATGQVEVDVLTQLPKEYLSLMWEVLQMCMIPYKSLRAGALSALQAVVKRFPNMAPLVMPHALAAIAGTSPPYPGLLPEALLSAGSVSSEAAKQQVQQVLQPWLEGTLRQLMLSQPGDQGSMVAGGTTAAKPQGPAAAGLVVTAAAAARTVAVGATPALPARAAVPLAAAAVTAAQESENDGRVAGAVAVASGSIECWRAVFYEPLLFCGMLRALLASRTHTSTTAQNCVADLLVQMVARIKYPRNMSFTSPLFQQLQSDLLTLAEPGHLRGSWRYTILANVFTMYMAPPTDVPEVLPVTRHCLSLLRSDVLLLRQIGMGGLYLQLSALVDYGLSNEGVVQLVAQFLSSSPDTGEQLLKRLVLSHAKLDAAAEGRRSAGGGTRNFTWRVNAGGNFGGLAQLMNITFEELLGNMVGAAVERFDRWPPDGERPPAVSDGTFEVGHARLLRLLASTCPQQLVPLLQQPLLSRMQQYSQPTGPQEKAEQAAVAEAVAGLLAAAAVPASSSHSSSSSGDSAGDWLWGLVRSAMASTTLDMAESWAVALRYGLHYLLKAAGSTGPRAEVGAAGFVPAVAAQPVLEEVISCILSSPGGRSQNALPSELKRLKYILQGVDAVRQYCSNSSSTGSSRGGVRAASQQGGINSTSSSVPGLLICGWGSEPPKMVRTFLAGVMQEVETLLSSEQPSAVRECLGSLLAEVFVLFSPSLQLDGFLQQLPAQYRGSNGSSGSPGGSVVVVDTAAALEEQMQAGMMPMEVEEGGGSGSSTPVELDLSAAGAGDEGKAEEGTVLLLHCSMRSLQAQAQKLATQVLCSFSATAQQLQGLKGAGTRSPGDAQEAPGGSKADGQVASGAAAADVVMVDQPQGGTEVSTGEAAAGEAGQIGCALTAELAPEDIPAVAARAGVGLQLVAAACLDGDAGMLRPLLLAMLRPVLLLQELAGPSLQQLATEAKTGFVMLKYVPYLPKQISAAAAAIVRAGASPYWSSRAAALVYLQLFWFRHCFLLSPTEVAALQQLVLQGLQDPQAEVRHLAGATLSGLIKGLPAAEALAVRDRLLQQAAALFGAGPGSGSRQRHSRGAGSSSSRAGASLPEAQACIQGLKALVMSSPYDCPGWMVEVLMALVAAASSKQPLVRRDASRALSEFKRTHEQDALEELRARLTEEQWEALQQVTSNASYFV